MYEVQIWEWSVLNPINFMMLSMLEYALKRSGISAEEKKEIEKIDPKLLTRFTGTNQTLRVWLMKVHGKLGLSTKFAAVSKNLILKDENYEKFGALKYSHYQAFGTERELDATCPKYEKYFSEAIVKNKEISLVQ